MCELRSFGVKLTFQFLAAGIYFRISIHLCTRLTVFGAPVLRCAHSIRCVCALDLFRFPLLFIRCWCADVLEQNRNVWMNIEIWSEQDTNQHWQATLMDCCLIWVERGTENTKFSTQLSFFGKIRNFSFDFGKWHQERTFCDFRHPHIRIGTHYYANKMRVIN